MDFDKISIATFNLLNLNLPGKSLYGQVGWTQPQYKAKIAWSADQIKRMAPDVVGFQELWDKQCLADLLSVDGLGADYDALAPEAADGDSIVCAALVRKDLLEGEPDWIAHFPENFVLEGKGGDPQTPAIRVGIDGFSRPILHFVVKPRSDEQPIHFYVCHFKSKAPTTIRDEPWYLANLHSKHQNNLGSALSTIRRTAEAAALRFMLTERLKGNTTPVVVLGDVNDGVHSNTHNILTEQPQYLGGGTLGGGDVALYAAQTLQEFRDTRDVYYTYVHKGMRESLDHILVSEQFYDHSARRRWLFDGMIVNNDHLNFADQKTSGTNDHGIIRAVFKHKPI